ncbi:MAG TPA: hypothetical protein DCP32_04905 [Anaerolineaceae bacterium]|nr:MAG: hypothetical protein A2X24_10780 [Chloroflexi bacterium GWB2_54_36]HAL16098.1 hypothetical protein [Anaerolineaceae bacterium]
MNFQLTLALRYLNGRKLRALLTTLAIVFGVLVVFGMNTIIPAMMQSFQANVLAASGQVDASISLKTGDVFPVDELARVASVPGVRALTGLLDRTVNLQPNYFDHDSAAPDSVSALSVVGLDPIEVRNVHSYNIVAGRFLEENDTNAAVISQSLADNIGVGLGSDLKLPTAIGEQTLNIIGILPARAMPGNEEIYVTLSQAQGMFGMPEKINTIDANLDSLDNARRLEIQSAIQTALGSEYQIGALSSNSELLTNLQVGQTIFNVLGIMGLLMGGFIIFNTFRTVVAERRRDIGMLRALGASRKSIFYIILIEGLVQGVFGTAIGMAAGYGFSVLVLKLMGPALQTFINVQLGMPVVTLPIILASIGLGVGITLLAGLIPAVSASRVTPLEALRPTVGKLNFRRLAGLGFWAGVTMIALAVAALLTRNAGFIGAGGLLFIIGLILIAPALVSPIAALFGGLASLIFTRQGTAHLAQGNLSRQPARAAVTASATMIGLAILVTAASIITSASIGFERVLRKSLGSDYLLIPPSIGVWGSNVGSNPDFARELRAVAGVAVVSSLRFAPAQVNDLPISLMGIEPGVYGQVSGLTFSSGDESTAYAALKISRSIIVNPVLATSVGAKVGDLVDMLTPNGVKPYKVVAIGGDYLNAKIATGYVSQADIAADFGRTEDVLLQLNLTPTVDRDTAESAIKTVISRYPQYRLISGQGYIDENMQIFDVAFAAMYAVLLFLAVPSLIAMLNTLAIGVIERTREIGMLRAVGATRKQVRVIIVTEAIILAAIGTAFGLLAGLFLGYTTVETLHLAGFPMEYAFPAIGVVVTIAAGLLFGVLAAIIPARQAARLDVVQALHYE